MLRARMPRIPALQHPASIPIHMTLPALDQSVTTSLVRSVDVVGPTPPEALALLTEEALELIADLARRFRPQIRHARRTPGRRAAQPATWANTARTLYQLEESIEVDGMPVPAGLFDFGVFAFHAASDVRVRGSRPTFHLPKLESRADARLWNEIVRVAHEALGIPLGSIRAEIRLELRSA